MNKRVRNIVVAALFAAIVCVSTLFLQMPVGYGYVHPGDSFIYLAAMLLPQPFAAAASLIGGSLADLLCGMAVWAPSTAIIKACNTLPFWFVRKQRRIISAGTVVLSVLSGVITVAGYFIAEGMLYSWESAVAGIVGSVVQATISTAAFLAIGLLLDKFDFKHKIM